MHVLLKVVVCLLLASLAVSEDSKDGTVLQVDVRARWNHTFLLQEASEFMAEESEDLFWSFVESVSSSGVSTASSDKAQLDFALSFASQRLSRNSAILLELSLASRVHSPKVAMHRSLGEGLAPGDCVVVTKLFPPLSCSQFEDKPDVVGRSEEEASLFLEGDHVWNAGGKEQVVVYGSLGTPSFTSFFNKIKGDGDVALCFRHSGSSDRRMLLSGFNVATVVKSTEYKLSNEDASGERQPLSEQDRIHPVPEEEIRLLGAKISEAIATSDEPDVLLRKITQNLPSEAPAFVEKQLGTSFYDGLVKEQKMVPGGSNAVLVNGRNIQDDMNYFDVLHVIKEEMALRSTLTSLGMEKELITPLLVQLSGSQNQGDYFYDVRSPYVIWLNDLEKDASYQSWPRSILKYAQHRSHNLLKLSRNVLSAIFVVDPSKLDALSDLSQLVMRDTPLRFGVVLTGISPLTNMVSKCLQKLTEGAATSNRIEFVFLDMLAKAKDAHKVAKDRVNFALAKIGVSWRVGDVLEDPKYFGAKESNDWAVERGFADTSVFVVNGWVHPLKEKNNVQNILDRARQLQMRGAMYVYRQFLKDDVQDIHDWWLRVHQARTHRSNYITPSDAHPLRFVDLVKESVSPAYVAGSSNNASETYFVVCDPSSEEGFRLAASALQFVKKGSARVAFFNTGAPSTYSSALTDTNKSLEELTALFGDITEKRGRSEGKKTFFGISRGLVVNGRVIDLSDPSLRFTALDFELMSEFENAQRAAKVKKFVPSTLDNFSDLVMKIVSVVGSSPSHGIQRRLFAQSMKPNVVFGNGSFVVDAIVDPLSKAGQRFAGVVLPLARTLENVQVNIFLSPKTDATSLSLNEYAAYLTPTSLAFDSRGNIDYTANAVVFDRLPRATLFSLSLQVADAWVAEAVSAPYDLDNLRLVNMKESRVRAEFELSAILAEGKAANEQRNVKGINVQMRKGDVVRETTVMDSGYFQIQAFPGVWELSLKGGSVDFYKPLSKKIFVDSFRGSLFSVTTEFQNQEKAEEMERKRRAGRPRPMKRSSSWFGGKTRKVIVPKNDTIHVFSMCSGHLYERLTKIMMLTVTKTTKHPVKFWFVKNFLSPQFKDFLPVMAAKYGFQYELVTYRWPRWLRRQTEKQREIWGYKILFLDVLFPLDLDRVIMVDADQIVRADLWELMELDLEGAPYAYTPFCSKSSNRRVETKGFRFWESGHWKQALNGKPYHISALYVIDLKRFREMSAGDVLRSSYHRLSRDPGSLANLDQDLPNSLQDILPIYSLPEEWLWCGAWCTDKSLKKAKSIDLCNDPMKKMSKLEAARKIEPNWDRWDEEMRELTEGKKVERKDDL